MSNPLIIAAPAPARKWLEGRLPQDVEMRWVTDAASALAAVKGAEIGWLDTVPIPAASVAAMRAGNALKWVSTVGAGLDGWPFEEIRARGLIFTNGAGLGAIPCAEYAVLGMLAIAKGFPAVVEAQRTRNWLTRPPGVIELQGSRALIIGYGGIGKVLAARLQSFGVTISAVRRTPAPGMLSPQEWRARLGEFDWVILCAPPTKETEKMIGAAELAAMKRGAFLVNIGRGSLVDQEALIAALKDGPMAGAYLDVTDPEPLPSDNPLWALPNVILSMHLAGFSQTHTFERATALFLENLAAYREGRPMRNVVDLAKGY